MDLYESPKEVLVAANNRHDGHLRGTGRSVTRFGCGPFHLYNFLGGDPCGSLAFQLSIMTVPRR